MEIDMVSQTLPASRSIFSRPLIFVMSIISPVPRAPYFPFLRTRARVVVSRSVFFPGSLGLLAAFEKTSRFPFETSALDAGDFDCFAGGGMISKRRWGALDVVLQVL